MTDNVVHWPVTTPPPTADERTRDEADRQRRIFEWAEAVLEQLGLTEAVARARSNEELLAITLDVNNAEVILAIRDALHPTSGNKRADHFRGLKEGSLKAILRNRFADLKKRPGNRNKKRPVWWGARLD
jgi:hypothetical protein